VTAADTLAWLRRQIGICEEPRGSNKIDYWVEIGFPQFNGLQWCGVLQYLALKHGGADLSWTTPRRAIYTPTALADARAAGIFYTGTPRPGDPAWLDLDGRPGPEHAVTVEYVDHRGVHTIEGNLGDCVRHEIRGHEIIGYARVTYLEEDMGMTPETMIPLNGYARSALAAAGWDPLTEVRARQPWEWAFANGLFLRVELAELRAELAELRAELLDRPAVDVEALAEALATETDAAAIRAALADVLPNVRIGVQSEG
jgi:hypothetical protein